MQDWERIKRLLRSPPFDGEKIPPRWKDHLIERNKSIISMRRSGNTLAKISKQHGIAPERVRQIICQHNQENEV